MSCRALLEPDAVACVECGVKIAEIGTQTPTSTTPEAAAVPSRRNTLSFREDKNNRRFEASLTDAAMQSLGGVFGDLFAQRGVVRMPPQIAGTPARQAPVVEREKLTIPAAVETPDVMDTPLPPGPPATQNHPDRANLLRLFVAKGDKLELADNRLKASNGSDYLRRLTYLFLYAHEAHGRMAIPERDLKGMITTAKMMDGSGNARRWLRKRIGILTEGEDNVQLDFKGREEAVKALKAALDPSVQDGWNPDKVTRGAKSTKSSKAKGKAKS